MPHITITHSENIHHKNWSGICLQLHPLIAKTLPTELNSIKSRVFKATDYVVGDGDAANAFVHCHIEVMPGRCDAIKKLCSTTCLKQLTDALTAASSHLNVQISVHVSELDDSNYVKQQIPKQETF